MSASLLLKLPFMSLASRKGSNLKFALSVYRYLHYNAAYSKFCNPLLKCYGQLPLIVCSKYNYSAKPESNNTNPNKKLVTNHKIHENSQDENPIKSGNDEPKLGLFAKFKLMYKQYWYVLIPVHVITSVGWLGGFYYLSKSGVDIPALLQSLQLSESIVDKLKNSDMGHLAIAYLCYKIATPVRYMVTLGGTTFSIKYLESAGYIKPMPTKSELIQMYEDKKADRAKRKQDKLEMEQRSTEDK